MDTCHLENDILVILHFMNMHKNMKNKMHAVNLHELCNDTYSTYINSYSLCGKIKHCCLLKLKLEVFKKMYHDFILFMINDQVILKTHIRIIQPFFLSKINHIKSKIKIVKIRKIIILI